MKRNRWIAVLAAAAVVLAAYVLGASRPGAGDRDLPPASAAEPGPGPATAPEPAPEPGPTAEPAPEPEPSTEPEPATEPGSTTTVPKPKPPVVGPGGLVNPTTTTTVKPGAGLGLKAVPAPAKLVRATPPGPLTLAAKGHAYARQFCFRNAGDLVLDWELATDVVFKSSPLSGHLAGNAATCIEVWTVHPSFDPGETKTLVVDSTANSVSVSVRLAD